MKYKGIAIDQISIIKTPKIYFQLIVYIIVDILKWLRKFVTNSWLLLISILIVWGLVSTVEFLHPVHSFIMFAIYWIILGVASSIGLGTGLHTFVLYLGPHIAKVAMVATSCGHLPAMIPSRWDFDHFGKCQDTNSLILASSETIGFFGILLSVQIQAFLWGFGTALGELPPYFVAKKAAETRAELRKMSKQGNQGESKVDEEEEKLIEHEKEKHHLSSEEIEEILQLKRKPKTTLMEKAKILIYDNLQKYGFLTILACASIPNPLFDLAGITCGHFRIPFKTFFTATFIGKAIIKVHIQMLFVITIFRKQTLDWLLKLISSISQGLADMLNAAVESNRKVLHEPSSFSENKPWFAKLWDIFIIGMVGYFLLSIINAQVQEKAIELKDK